MRARKQQDDKENEDKKFIDAYQGHYKNILRYTDEIPRMFKKYKSLHQEWKFVAIKENL